MFRNVRKEEITIPAQMSYLLQIRQFVEHIGKKYRFSEKVINSFKLVVDEACTNIIKHSYGEEQEGKIDVAITISNDRIMISITDTGEKGQQFNPNNLPPFEKKRYLEQLERGGLGVYIIKTIMDEVEYNIQPGAFNKLKMVKYIIKT